MNERLFECHAVPRELDLLLRLALRQEVGEIPADFDWDCFTEYMDQHRVYPLVIRGIRQLPADLVERYPVLKQYRSRQNKYAMESLKLMKALAEAAKEFGENGIRMISMKGPLLSVELYGDPAMRVSNDLDVMVPEEDLVRAGQLLEGLGYRREVNLFHNTPLRRKFYSAIELEKHEEFRRDGVCIELHWRSNFQAEETFDALWENREERNLFGQRVAVMGCAQRYPALVIHGAEHGYKRLRWLLDLYELQKKPHFSWQEVYAAMEAQGVGALLLETLIVMYRLDLPGLREVSGERFSIRVDGGRVTLCYTDDLRETVDRAMALADASWGLICQEAQWEDSRWADYDRLLPTCMIQKTRFQTFLMVCGPTVYELELVDLPDSLFWLYFLIRPFNWLRRKLFGGTK